MAASWITAMSKLPFSSMGYHGLCCHMQLGKKVTIWMNRGPGFRVVKTWKGPAPSSERGFATKCYINKIEREDGSGHRWNVYTTEGWFHYDERTMALSIDVDEMCTVPHSECPGIHRCAEQYDGGCRLM